MAKQVMKKATLGGTLLSPSDYLAAVEFKGKDVTLTIKGIIRDELKTAEGSKEAPVMTFVETPKKFVLSAKINQSTIAGLYGARAEDWIGKRITLYPTTCNAFGNKDTDCIRVRAAIPKAKGAAPAPVTETPAPDADDNVPGSTPTPDPSAARNRAPSPAAIRETAPDDDFLNSVAAANPSLMQGGR